jgi:hypothetical protein
VSFLSQFDRVIKLFTRSRLTIVQQIARQTRVAWAAHIIRQFVEIQSSRNQSFRNYERKMIFLFQIKRLKDFFKYQTWQIEMRNQSIFMNFWHYVEIDELLNSTILIVEISIEEIFNVLVVSSTSKKIRKFKIDNLKTITIIRNRLKCNDRDFLKNEINVIKTWQIFKKSFSSCESKILNDLFIKLWIIILIIS